MKNDGGPAFPQLQDVPGGPYYVPGMTLRDYFAAHVDAPWDVSHTVAHDQLKRVPTIQETMDCQAQMRLGIADAMIAAREDK